MAGMEENTEGMVGGGNECRPRDRVRGTERIDVCF